MVMEKLDGVRIPSVPVEAVTNDIPGELIERVGRAAGLASIFASDTLHRVPSSAHKDFLTGQLFAGLASQELREAHEQPTPSDISSSTRFIGAELLGDLVVCPIWREEEGYTMIASVLLGTPGDIRQRLTPPPTDQ